MLELFGFRENNYYKLVNDSSVFLCVKNVGVYSIGLVEATGQYIAFDRRTTTTDRFDDVGAPRGAKYIIREPDTYERIDFIEHVGERTCDFTDEENIM
jgi:hypothetical protein